MKQRISWKIHKKYLIITVSVEMKELMHNLLLTHGIGSETPVEDLVRRSLTPRQQQTLSLILKYKSNKEIGTALNVSESAVKFHVKNLMEKFHVHSRGELFAIGGVK